MDSKIWNLEIVHADPKIVNIIDGYFPTGNISIMTLFRKLPFILMDLVEATSTGWQLLVPSSEEPKKGLELVLYELSEDADSPILTIKFPSMPNIVGIMEKVFAKDRWIKFRTRASVIELHRPCSSFRFFREFYKREKNKVIVDKLSMCVFTMEPIPVSIFRKLKYPFLALFRQRLDEVERHQVVSFISPTEDGRQTV